MDLRAYFVLLALGLAMAMMFVPVSAVNWTPYNASQDYTIDIVNSTYMVDWVWYLLQKDVQTTPGEHITNGNYETGDWTGWTTSGGATGILQGATVHDGSWAVQLEPTGWAAQSFDLNGLDGFDGWVYDGNCDVYIDGVYYTTMTGSAGVWTYKKIDLFNLSDPYEGVHSVKFQNNGAGTIYIDTFSSDADIVTPWEFPIIGFTASLMGPYTDAFGGFGGGEGNYVYLILWGLFLLMVWRNSGKITIPALIAVITAGAVGLLFPQSAQPWVMILLCAAIASQLFTFFSKE